MTKRIAALITSASLASTLALAGCSSSPAAPPSLAAMSASQILNRALSTAEARTSVHIKSAGTQGSLTEVQVDDALPDSGRQLITEGSSKAEVLLVGGVAYIKGNQDALLNYFEFPPTDGPALANRWISIPPSNSDYSTVSSQVDFTQFLSTFKLRGPLVKIGSSTVDGQRVVGIRGTAPAALGLPAKTSATLYVALSGPALPVSATYSSSSEQVADTLSNWDEKLALTKPVSALPISSVHVPSAT
ncbi:MAG: hypothetical protein ACRDX8_09225 [Acidimicrobiales bacterium]